MKDYIKSEMDYLGLQDFEKYNNLFEEKIIERGIELCENGSIESYSNNKNNYKCKIKGEDLYNVSFKLEDNELTNMKCTCPYFKNGKKCKHLYALLYKVLMENDVHILKESLKRYNDWFKDELNNSRRFMYLFSNRYSNDDYNNYLDYYKQYTKFTQNVDKELNSNKSEKRYLLLYKNIKDDIKDFREEYYKIIKNRLPLVLPKVQSEDYKEEKLKVSDVVAGVITFNSILNSITNNKKKRRDSLDDWGLSKYEKEMVRKGYYEPWQLNESTDTLENEYYNDDGTYKN